jgi:rSAM/selenodomain-associated transferase 1
LKSALIIFVRNPVLGKVKTRLAASLGDQKALEIYKSLLTHTLEISKDLKEDKYIFYEDFISSQDIWPNDIYNKKLQQGNSLGDRMKDAFDLLFKKGFGKAIIIGSDCFELTPEVLNDAFNRLSTNDIVIGPATDGGYYLLGMNHFIPVLFDDKQWSSSSVYADTVSQIRRLGKTFYSLTMMNDVDEESDVDFSKIKMTGDED